MSTASDPPRTRWRSGLAAALGALALIEAAAALWAAREPIGPDDWTALAQAIDARGDEAPVLLATGWLGPSARMHVPAIAQLDALTLPDLHGVPRFHVVGLGAVWSDALESAREGVAAPRQVATQAIGPFSWASYEGDGARVLTTLTRDGAGLVARTDAGPCRGRERLRCDEGEIAPRIVEVDYQPRRCLGLSLRDGTTVTLQWSAVTLGHRLRGHIGMGDYNARLRNDAPVDVRVRIDGVLVRHATVTDAQGWWPFELPTEPGRGRVELELVAGLSGGWSGRNYDGTPHRTICLELRALEDPR
ncbi:MAG: hypothetical protein U0168_08130 [Nannocystaceae bacterium]